MKYHLDDYSGLDIASNNKIIVDNGNQFIYNIDLHEGLYKWIKAEGAIKAFDFHKDAYQGKVKGLLTHTNIRKDKFDCSPQPNLVDMIMSL